MKRFGYLVSIAICCVCIFMVGCSEISGTKVRDDAPQEGWRYEVDGASNAESIPDATYEDYEHHSSAPPEGLRYAVAGVPKAEDFSGSAYEDYEHHFLPVSSATYHHGGIAEDISPDDPRLIRLLNFLAYSEEISASFILQSYVEGDAIRNYLSSDARMLEINFDYDGTSSSYLSTYKILICGHTYLTFIDTQKSSWVLGEGEFAEQRYPYNEMLFDQVMIGALPEDVLYENTWGGPNWLDILTYCGF